MTATTQALVTLVKDGLSVIGLLGWMLYLNWKLSLLVLLITPGITIIMRLVSSRLRRLSRELQELMGGLTHVIDEVLQGHKVIKIFIDHGARLWTRIGFADAPRREDPLVVGIELTARDSDERTVLRDQLRRRFKYYADPRSVPYSKWMLKPNMDHVYDLLVLRPGQPCLEVNEEEVWLLEQRIKKQLQMIE